MCLQSHRSTAQFTVQATCAAGLPVSWEQRGRERQTNKIALTSVAWWQWDVSTPTHLPRLMEKSELNPQSSLHVTPWMGNSPLSIKGRNKGIVGHRCWLKYGFVDIIYSDA